MMMYGMARLTVIDVRDWTEETGSGCTRCINYIGDDTFCQKLQFSKKLDRLAMRIIDAARSNEWNVRDDEGRFIWTWLMVAGRDLVASPVQYPAPGQCKWDDATGGLSLIFILACGGCISLDRRHGWAEFP